MNPQDLKQHIPHLPEASQEALGTILLQDFQKRSQLEKIAAGSVWIRSRWIISLVVLPLLIINRNDLIDLLPLIIVYILFLIHSENAATHRRLDAIYELHKLNQLPATPRHPHTGPPARQP